MWPKTRAPSCRAVDPTSTRLACCDYSGAICPHRYLEQCAHARAFNKSTTEENSLLLPVSSSRSRPCAAERPLASARSGIERARILSAFVALAVLVALAFSHSELHARCAGGPSNTVQEISNKCETCSQDVSNKRVLVYIVVNIGRDYNLSDELIHRGGKPCLFLSVPISAVASSLRCSAIDRACHSVAPRIARRTDCGGVGRERSRCARLPLNLPL